MEMISNGNPLSLNLSRDGKRRYEMKTCCGNCRHYIPDRRQCHLLLAEFRLSIKEDWLKPDHGSKCDMFEEKLPEFIERWRKKL